MKVIKIFSLAIAMAFAMNANAQDKGHFTVNANFGSVCTVGGFGLGIGYQKTILEKNDWELAWDVAQFEWDAPFKSPADLDYINIRSGVRGFTPSFASGKLRAYTNFDLGYTLVITETITFSYDKYGFPTDYKTKKKAYSAFGLQFGAGFQWNKKISLGYTLQYETKFKSKNHLATIAYTF